MERGSKIMASKKNKFRFLVAGMLVVGFMAACLFYFIDNPFDIRSVDGIEEGMSKGEVVNALIDGEVSFVNFYSGLSGRLPVDEVLKEDFSGEVCVNDNLGFSVRVKVSSDGGVDKIYESAAAKMTNVSYENREGFVKSIKRVMLKEGLAFYICEGGMVTVPVNQESRRFYIEDDSEEWSYQRSKGYSFVLVSFNNGVVSRIRYRWRPFEM